ncbi:MAG TPA: serine/threonine-protein kinase [Ktedonobacteraceae bacterium]|nr:serine/threonine-protein kinase [Ktedonobacteraceae bacterium]
MQDAQATLSAGILIRDRYLVKSLIAEGNAGAVYLVEDQRVKRARQYVFALKEIIGLNKQERYQYILDSILLTRINHPALPRIYHVFSDDSRSRVCIVMDYVEGLDTETLRQRQPEQRFSWPEVARLMAPIVDAVSYLHCQAPPIVHGDIKPVNILRAQPEARFMLVDMGIIRQHHPDSGVLSALSDLDSGSGYKAPEQNGRAEDVRADIYGLGATCYTLLTGSVPLNALARLAEIEQGEADPLQPANSVVATVPPHVSRAIQQAMSPYAHERFASVEEFWQALQTSPKEHWLTIDDTVSSDTMSRPALTLTGQVRRLAGLQIPLPSRQHRKSPPLSLFLKRHMVHLLLLIILVLVGVSAAGAGTWAYMQGHQPAATARRRTTKSLRPRPTPPSINMTPIVTPTSSPGNYPSVAGSYTGTLVDVSAKVSETMILQGIHQIGGTINGYFTSGSPLALSGPFSGTIDPSKHLQFTVNDAAGHPALFLEGAIQTAASLSGDFYTCASPPTSGETCSRAPNGYGIWSAQLQQP